MKLPEIFTILKKRRQKKLALSMRGGAARAYGYLGVLKVLEENNIKIDMIIGSSGGTLIGCIYGAGNSIEDTIKHAETFDLKKMWSIDALKHADITDRDKMMSWGGVLVGDKNIEDLSIKNYVQVTNLSNFSGEIVDKGLIKTWTAASCAFPFLMEPKEINGNIYADGDLTSGYDAAFVRSQGAEVVIGLNAHTQRTPYDSSIPDKVVNMFNLSRQRILELDQKVNPVDIHIGDMGESIGFLDFHKAREAFDNGYYIAKTYESKILDLLYK